MDLNGAKGSFLNLLGSLASAEEKEAFLSWIKVDILPQLSARVEDLSDSRKLLASVADFCRGLFDNLEAVVASEDIKVPENSSEGFTELNAMHLDAFLYDDVAVQQLAKEGKLPQAVCLKCGSRETNEIQLITHSCSRERLEFIFRALLPDLKGMRLLDVGSRIGAVLFGAHVLSNAAAIVGLELNGDLCRMAQKTVDAFRFDDRVRVVHGELTTRPDLTHDADVVILNNVFDWFAPVPVQVIMWQFLYKTVKSGALIVSIPSLEESLSRIDSGIDISKWVRSVPPTNPDNVPIDQLEEELEQVKLYQVL